MLLTRVQSGRNGIKHVRVHVSVNGPVGGGVVPSSDEDRIPLSNSHRNEVRAVLLCVSLTKNQKNIVSTPIQKADHAFAENSGTYTVSFDDPHIMSVNPEEERRERANVDDTQPVSLAGLHTQKKKTGSTMSTT